MTLKVLSWNIWYGKYLDKIIDFLKENNPDVISLQEVIESQNVENIAKQIADELGYQYIYCNAFETDRHQTVYRQGNAILTRYEIISSRCHLLSEMDQYKNSAESEPRVAAEAVIKLENGENVRIFAVHLAYSYGFQPSKLRGFQAQNLVKLLPGNETILMGDFNSHPDGEVIKKSISKVMVNADQNLDKSTWTVYPFDYKGFVETKLAHRIDYIFVSKDIRVRSFEVLNSDGSDHLPISAVVEV